MSKKFNLLSLHQLEDVHPRTWICLKGPRLQIICKNLEKEILKDQGWCREKLSKEIAYRLKCAHTTVKQTLLGKHEFFPIPIITELLKLSKNKEKISKEIKNNIKYLKVNSASAKPIRAIYELNENLAKILGAFMADGSLSIQVVIAAYNYNDLEKAKSKLRGLKIHYSTGIAPSRNQNYISVQANKNNFQTLKKVLSSLNYLIQTHHSIELSDEYKDSVEAFVEWIKKEFDIIPNRFEKRRNAWRVSFQNKILSRYLMRFFEVKPGPKAYYAFEPKIIKRSNLKLRRAFAKGVLMFDGCVTKDRKISLGTVSRDLSNSIKQIWKEDNIKFRESISERGCYSKLNKNYILFTISTTAKNKKEKLLKYFEVHTQKWKLLNWLSGNLNYIPIIKEDYSLSLEKVFKFLQKTKVCDVIYLKNHFQCAHTTMYTYLRVLKNQGKIKLSNQPSKLNNYVSENTTIFLRDKYHQLLFKNIRKKFGRDKNFIKFIGIHKATFSSWRVKKNRIPVDILREICKILDLNFNKISKNIKEADREIAEII